MILIEYMHENMVYTNFLVPLMNTTFNEEKSDKEKNKKIKKEEIVKEEIIIDEVKHIKMFHSKMLCVNLIGKDKKLISEKNNYKMVEEINVDNISKIILQSNEKSNNIVFTVKIFYESNKDDDYIFNLHIEKNMNKRIVDTYNMAWNFIKRNNKKR